MKARLTFREIVQDSQEYGSDDEHMVSRVFFTMEIGGRKEGDFYADVKQTVGSDFETAPLEVGPPQGYSGRLDQEVFREAIERYYRDLVGSQGTGIRIQGGASIRMRNNRLVKTRVVAIPLSQEAGW